MRSRSAALAALVPLALASVTLVSAGTAQAATSAGSYHPLPQTRIVDTRFGIGAPVAKVGPNGTLTFAAVGQGGVPTTDVAAVVFNLTAVVPSQGSFITAYPAGPTKPEVSNLNVDAGVTRANQVTVPVGANGAVSLYNAFGSVDMLVDILGYYDTNGSSGGRYPMLQLRIFDSRTPEDAPALAPGETITTGLTFNEPSFDQHITALAVNLTAINPDAEGYLSTWDGSVIQPTTSTVNFRAQDVVPNAAIVPVAHTTENGMDYSVIELRNISRPETPTSPSTSPGSIWTVRSSPICGSRTSLRRGSSTRGSASAASPRSGRSRPRARRSRTRCSPASRTASPATSPLSFPRARRTSPCGRRERTSRTPAR
jgi:hypothetical protein